MVPRILSLLFLCVASCFFRVEAKTGKGTYQVYINAPDHSVKAFILADPVKVNADIDRTYYWYASNRIMGTKGGYDGKLLHGEFTSFYLNNSLKEKGMFRKGLKHGKWISWYSNGNIKEIINWRSGSKQGKCSTFTEDGKLLREAHYNNDMLSGKYIEFENGEKRIEKRYRKGKEQFPKQKKSREKKHSSMDTSTVTNKELNESLSPGEKKPVHKKLKRLLIRREPRHRDTSKNKVIPKPEKKRVLFRGKKKDA